MAGKKQDAAAEIDRLFALPPEEFVTARDELAKRLKADGRAEVAAEAKALRRPTVAAWAANQVARQHQADVDELLAAGAELRQAQRKVLSGVRSGGFREAMDRRRKVVTRLAGAAERLLAEAGHGSPGAAEAVAATFEAASVDEQVAELVRAGRLSKGLPAPSGFGDVTGLAVVPAPPPEPKAGSRAKGADRAERAAAEAAARREEREREKAAAEARRRAIKARAEADRAQEKADRLAAEADQARRSARDLARTAREAESEADQADRRRSR